MASIFSKIINREIPAYIISENDEFIAFLDINPNTKGHTLVIPKIEVDYIFDLEIKQYAKLFEFAQVIAKALKRATLCEKVGMAVVGLEVPHAHIHLIPMQSAADFNFNKSKLKLEEKEFEEIQQKIIAELKN